MYWKAIQMLWGGTEIVPHGWIWCTTDSVPLWNTIAQYFFSGGLCFYGVVLSLFCWLPLITDTGVNYSRHPPCMERTHQASPLHTSMTVIYVLEPQGMCTQWKWPQIPHQNPIAFLMGNPRSSSHSKLRRGIWNLKCREKSDVTSNADSTSDCRDTD